MASLGHNELIYPYMVIVSPGINVLTHRVLNFPQKKKIIVHCVFAIISLHRWQEKICLSYTIDTIAVDDLEMQGSMASAALLVITWFWNIPVSVPKRLTAQYITKIIWHGTKKYICEYVILHIDGLVRERCNSSALAMELRLSCTKPSIYCEICPAFCCALFYCVCWQLTQR